MRKSRFTEGQFVSILKEAEAGATVKEICRRHGISDATYYNCKSRYGGMTTYEDAGLVGGMLAAPRPCFVRDSTRSIRTRGHNHRRRVTIGQNLVDSIRLAPVYRQTIFAPDGDRSLREPALVVLWLPLGHIQCALLVAIEIRLRQREVQYVLSEGSPSAVGSSAQAAVVGFRTGDDVFDIRLALTRIALQRIRAEQAVLSVDNVVLDGLRVRVVGRFVGRTAVLVRNLHAHESIHSGPHDRPIRLVRGFARLSQQDPQDQW